MNPDLAKIIFVVVMAIGFVVWIWSLQMALGITRRMGEPDWRLLDDDQLTQSNTESGSRTVRGTPESLSAALARSLTQLNVGTFNALFEITERSPRRILLKKTGPLMCNQPAGLYFSEAEITFENVGHDTTKVSYVLGFDRLAQRVQRVALVIILGIGLPTLVIVGAVMWYFVLPSNNPGVKWQVLQTLQISHALWPPFLFLGLYSAGRRQSKTYMSNLLSTLELAE